MSSNRNSTTLPGAVATCCSGRTLLAASATFVALRILLVALLLCLCFVLLRHRWRSNARLAQDQPQHPKVGLDAAAIALLPSFPYRRAVAEAARVEECAVCLSDFDEGQTVRRLPGCKHVFHQECIDVWLAFNASCPVCRGNAEERAAASTAASCVVPIEMLDDDTVSSTSTEEEAERALSTRRRAGNDDLA